jgi:hypothetical protein
MIRIPEPNGIGSSYRVLLEHVLVLLQGSSLIRPRLELLGLALIAIS